VGGSGQGAPPCRARAGACAGGEWGEARRRRRRRVGMCGAGVGWLCLVTGVGAFTGAPLPPPPMRASSWGNNRSPPLATGRLDMRLEMDVGEWGLQMRTVAQTLREKATLYHDKATEVMERVWGREAIEKLETESVRDNYNLGGLPAQKSVTETAEWQRLEIHARNMKRTHLKDLMNNVRRCEALTAEFEGVFLDYSRMQVSQRTMQLLLALAKRQGLEEKIQAMVRGDPINATEGRAVLHTALRAAPDDEPVMVNGVNVISEVHSVLDKVKTFSEQVRSGERRGATGRLLRNIVAVGIGGSYLGPEFVHEAFKTEVTSRSDRSEFYRLRFLSNVDPVDVRRTLYDLNPEETLVIVISKTFTTAETMLNARTARQWLWDSMGRDPSTVEGHMVACASTSALGLVEEFGIPRSQLFEFWDWVGGRYSVCSSVGALPLSLKYGFGAFEKFLAGARAIDKHFIHAPFDKNLPVLMGLLGVWNISFMGYKARTILPYAEALLKLPAHIQQLSMESNGKRVTIDGRELDYDIGQIDFGEPGTNGQHSFFQLLHMGQVCPAEFIGFIESQHHLHVEGELVASHDELMANFFAQPDALAFGKSVEELQREGCKQELLPHRTFSGNRPSLSILIPKVNAYYLGQILALYEHRTATEGFMWDINSFDQWGVELGKILASKVRSKMQAFREGAEAHPNGFNPSTQRLLSRYLEHSDSLMKAIGVKNHSP
jgi:glucose-6-phosphate isomerase